MATRIRSAAHLCTIALVLLGASRHVHAGWSPDPGVNLRICAAGQEQFLPVAASDGAGGIYIAWQDARETYPARVYLQRVAADGATAWTVDGLPACLSESSTMVPAIVADGLGGAVVAWLDRRGAGGIRVQRFSASGAASWAPEGVVVCEAPGRQELPVLAADGTGGVIVAWRDVRDDARGRIYAQHVAAHGGVTWAVNGVRVTTAGDWQTNPAIVADGSGGALVVWEHGLATSGGYDGDIRAQRVSAAGLPAWPAEGVALCSVAGTQGLPVVATDGDGGAIVAWSDGRDGPLGVYAQRVGPSGACLWEPQGAALSAPGSDCSQPVLAADGAGGSFAGWRNWDADGCSLVVMKVASSGLPSWHAGRMSVVEPWAAGGNLALVADSAAGVIVAWSDLPVADVNLDIFSQRFDADGGAMWPGGALVCTAADRQESPLIVGDGQQGAIIAWHDLRDDALTAGDIYAQRVLADGRLAGSPAPVPERAAQWLTCVPNPFNPQTEIRFEIPAAGPVRLDLSDVAGRRVRTLVAGERAAGVHRVRWDGTDEQGQGVAAGLYCARLVTTWGVSTFNVVLVR